MAYEFSQETNCKNLFCVSSLVQPVFNVPTIVADSYILFPITPISARSKTILSKEEIKVIAVKYLNRSTRLSLIIINMKVAKVAKKPSISLNRFKISHHLCWISCCCKDVLEPFDRFCDDSQIASWTRRFKNMAMACPACKVKSTRLAKLSQFSFANPTLFELYS